MTHWTSLFIECCWIAWMLYWLIMAFQTKRTVERGAFIGYRLVAIIVFLGLFAIGRLLLHVSAQSQLWPRTLALGVLSDCIVLAGPPSRFGRELRSVATGAPRSRSRRITS
jgi:fumarate reductase subunit C